MHSPVVILGGGSGGMAVAAKLHKQRQILLVEPSDTHYFQPAWTLAGAGLVNPKASARPMKALVPKGVTWIKKRVSRIDPEQNTVYLDDHPPISYESLVVATGLRLAWEKIPGLSRICSIYDYNQLEFTARQIADFKGGHALFIMPPTPIKCAGAPQKIMYLADDLWRKKGLKYEVTFAVAGPAMFSVPLFADALTKIAKNKGIKCLFSHRLTGVEKNEAIFEGQRIAFDFLHVVPPMEAHDYIQHSGLADQSGWLAVDAETLRHLRYENIFGIGDVTGIPNSKTAAAVSRQVPVVVANLLVRSARYDGYSCCPITTERGKVMLAEFGYQGKLMPSVPLDPAKPRRIMWYYYRYVLPWHYWRTFKS